jgi:lipoate-protein ligase A
VGGKKVVGSAQKRGRRAFLQHGSILLEKDAALLAAVSKPGESAEGAGMTSLSEALGRPVDFDGAVGPLVQGFADFFGVSFERFALSPADKEAVRAIQASKYAADGWTYRGGTAAR